MSFAQATDKDSALPNAIVQAESCTKEVVDA